MAGQEDPESRSIARQLVALLAGLKARKEERDGKTLQFKQIAEAVHRHMKTDKTGKWPVDRDKPYAVSHLHGVLDTKSPNTPSPSLSFWARATIRLIGPHPARPPRGNLDGGSQW